MDMPNILCRFVSKHGILFLCIELLALPTAADGNETKFKEMGEDSFGIATFVRAEEARDRILVGEEGAEKQKPFKSSSSPAKGPSMSFYPDFILILSKFYPDKIKTKFG